MGSTSINFQPTLFDFSDSATGVAELFPSVWCALEELTSPNEGLRHQALDRLIEIGAHRLSPLVAYVLATRLDDSDIEVRYRVIQALGDVLSPQDASLEAPELVRQHIKYYVSQMRRRNIYALLQVAEHKISAESSVAALMNACSYAGNALIDIFSDRKTSLPIRRQAIIFVGRVGFLNAIPALEKLADRLAARLNGQSAMPFAPPTEADDKSLLPAVQTALTLLKTP
jgi:HEAT repeat protein